jgi:DNA-directed RNA polymerase subunit RPC12/RpoP
MEKITLQCSLCNKTIDTTHNEFIQRQKTHGYKCWVCGHGDLSIIWGEYSELALIIHRAAQELKKIDPTDAARLAQPITDLIIEVLPIKK